MNVHYLACITAPYFKRRYFSPPFYFRIGEERHCRLFYFLFLYYIRFNRWRTLLPYTTAYPGLRTHVRSWIGWLERSCYMFSFLLPAELCLLFNVTWLLSAFWLSVKCIFKRFRRSSCSKRNLRNALCWTRSATAIAKYACSYYYWCISCLSSSLFTIIFLNVRPQNLLITS